MMQVMTLLTTWMNIMIFELKFAEMFLIFENFAHPIVRKAKNIKL